MKRIKKIALAMLGLMPCLWTASAPAEAEPKQALSFGISYGNFVAAENAKLSGQDPGGAINVGIDYRFHPRFAIGVDFESHGQQAKRPEGMRAPFLGTIDDHMNINTASMAFQGIYSVPIWRTRLHLGAGAGLYRTQLTIDGTLLGIPGTYVDETENSLGTHLFARWDLRLKKDWWLGAEHRRIDASADFGRWAGGEIDVGGVVNMITLRKEFNLAPWLPPHGGAS